MLDINLSVDEQTGEFDLKDAEFHSEDRKKTYEQWSVVSPDSFSPTTKTVKTLTPGLYTIEDVPNIGIQFKKIENNVGSLLKFPQTNVDIILEDIKKFLNNKDKYKAIKQLYKRGFLFYGIAGGGKSSAIQLVIHELIKNNGIAIKLDNPYRFEKAMRMFRNIEPERNIVVLMEDIDSIIEEYEESTILNLLDGVGQIENVIYLATTNYPDKLLTRLTNRPSRFDRIFEFGPPTEDTRKIYLATLLEDYNKFLGKNISIPIQDWIKDTTTLTIAHLKELFISTIVFNYDYEKTLNTLKGMKKPLKSKEDSGSGHVGFGSRGD